MEQSNFLGVAALYHDSAAALVSGGRLVAAAEEERFTRVKHDPRFPSEAIAYCLSQLPAGERLDGIVFYEDEVLTIDRVLKNALAAAPSGSDAWSKAASSMLGGKLFIREKLAMVAGDEVPLLFVDHHRAHAASAFYPSPFESAAVLVIDGVGEWATTTIGSAHDAEIELLAEIRYPHSLGLLYSAFTSFCGFRVNSGEYKLMGLAPYGTARYEKLIREHLIDLRTDGSYRLNLDYFAFHHSARMTNSAFERLFEGPPREPESMITQRERDLAASVQLVLEDAVFALAREAKRRTGEERLCMAGGVALNCVANGKLSESKLFEQLWIQPAASDAGGSVGAAYLGYHVFGKHPRVKSASPSRADAQRASLLGPSYSNDDVRAVLAEAGCTFEYVADRKQLHQRVAAALAEGSIVGYFSGAMEFGPRALGARSILCDPRRQDAQSMLNQKIKFRESWRPFAAAVLAEDAAEFFTLREENPYMLLVAQVRENHRVGDAQVDQTENLMDVLSRSRTDIPAVTHVDFSSRVQTVSPADNADLYDLLQAFKLITGCGMLVNTSFNVRGEPVVCTPREAFTCFANTSIDLLVVENFLVRRADQDFSDHVPVGVPYALD